MTILKCWKKRPHLTHTWYAEEQAGQRGKNYSCPGIETPVHKYSPDAGWCVECGPDIYSARQSTPTSPIHQTQWKTVCLHCGVDMFSREDEYEYKTNWYPGTPCPRNPHWKWALRGPHKPQDVPVLPEPSSTWLSDALAKVRERRDAAQTGQESSSTVRNYRPKVR